MPADVTGTTIVVETESLGAREFQFRKGPIFAQIVSPTRSTARRPRRSRRCSRRCRSAPSRSAARRTSSTRAVLRHGDAEPDRAGGHVPAARGAARPLLLQARRRLLESRGALGEILNRTTAGAEPEIKPVLDGPGDPRAPGAGAPRRRSPRTIQDYAVRLVLATHPARATGEFATPIGQPVPALRRQPTCRPGARAGRQGAARCSTAGPTSQRRRHPRRGPAERCVTAASSTSRARPRASRRTR